MVKKIGLIRNNLKPADKDKILKVLKIRFENNKVRHKDVKWADVQKKLEANPDKIWSLNEMEKTGGEPDVLSYERNTGEYIFVDCSAESPAGRRNVCYDREGLDSRKNYKPENNAIDMASEMDIEILTEKQYRELQETGNYDTKTSSWIFTPTEIRKLGGALFADRRYGKVFIYHNSAPSYYGVRGFRGILRV